MSTRRHPGGKTLLLSLLLTVPVYPQQCQTPAKASPSPMPTRPATKAAVISPVLPPLTEKERRSAYLHALVGRQRLVASALTAGLLQVAEKPHEWTQSPTGFGERYADSMARNAISETVGFGIARTLHEDPRYHPLLSGTVLARAWWALRWTAMIHTEDGGVQPNLPAFVGAYSSEFIANSWYPASVSDPQNALRRGSYVLIGEYAFNLWSEFGRGWLAGRRRHKTRVPPPVHK